MNAELGKIAYTDQLTKIFNRWEIEKKLEDNIELLVKRAYDALYMAKESGRNKVVTNF